MFVFAKDVGKTIGVEACSGRERIKEWLYNAMSCLCLAIFGVRFNWVFLGLRVLDEFLPIVTLPTHSEFPLLFCVYILKQLQGSMFFILILFWHIIFCKSKLQIRLCWWLFYFKIMRNILIVFKNYKYQLVNFS